MIQRIQTLYLLVSLGLLILAFFFPVAELASGNSQSVTFRITGFYDEATGNLIMAAIPVIIIISVIFCLHILAIILFKRRIIQMRLCVFIIILLVGLIGLFIFHLLFYVKIIKGVEYTIGISFIIPLIDIILTYLAFRGIRKDEFLVRLADRIR